MFFTFVYFHKIKKKYSFTYTVILNDRENIIKIIFFFFIKKFFLCPFSLKLECEKLASEKIEIQRHYVMVSLKTNDEKETAKKNRQIWRPPLAHPGMWNLCHLLIFFIFLLLLHIADCRVWSEPELDFPFCFIR